MAHALRARVVDRLEELFAAEGEDAGREFKQEPGARRLANLLDKDPLFAECMVLAPLLDYVAAVLRDRFKLSSLNARSANPNNGLDQPLHADGGALPDERGAWVCNLLWMLDDFHADNGALRVVPGTHRAGKLPAEALADPRTPHPEQELITGRAGDVLVTNAHLCARRPGQPHAPSAAGAARLLLPLGQAPAAIPAPHVARLRTSPADRPATRPMRPRRPAERRAQRDGIGPQRLSEVERRPTSSGEEAQSIAALKRRTPLAPRAGDAVVGGEEAHAAGDGGAAGHGGAAAVAEDRDPLGHSLHARHPLGLAPDVPADRRGHVHDADVPGRPRPGGAQAIRMVKVPPSFSPRSASAPAVRPMSRRRRSPSSRSGPWRCGTWPPGCPRCSWRSTRPASPRSRSRRRCRGQPHLEATVLQRRPQARVTRGEAGGAAHDEEDHLRRGGLEGGIPGVRQGRVDRARGFPAGIARAIDRDPVDRGGVRAETRASITTPNPPSPPMPPTPPTPPWLIRASAPTGSRASVRVARSADCEARSRTDRRRLRHDAAT